MKHTVDIPESERHPLELGEVILVDKPLGWTSFNVVSRVRNWAHRQVGRRVKTGHAGTLDPLASGLLIVCLGRYTKKIEEFQAQKKEYTGTFTIGSVTKSYDLESEVIPGGDYSHIGDKEINDAVKRLSGEIMQVPPVFSAVKVQGKRAYQYARADRELKLEAKPVTIYEFEITRVELPEIDFRIVCSKGTYIRSIARDFGELLGCGAHLSALRRTKIGSFRVENARNVDEFLSRPE
ncbi:MAG: tRNA pseudouridine(55) synthase TruB [Bacteroides sp.]|nr:tRNA pseudouridine(55) synthase TruB [Bacteroides sp.]MCM1086109.1 tRNA pseudouridine(55) synthase TruB [Bacteroides sp.]